MTRIKKYLPLLVLLTSALIVWALGLHHYLSLDVLRSYHQELEQLVASHKVLSFAIYALVYMGVVALSLPGATFMTLLGGFLFGLIGGTFIVVISATSGAALLFMAVRQASQHFSNDKTAEWVKKMRKGFKENEISYLLTLRLIPIFPFVAINLAAALLDISFRVFFWCTLVGIIPGSFIYVSIGFSLKDVIALPNFTPDLLLKPSLLIGLGGLGLLSLLPALYKAYRKKN